jgi:hypothetical protein
MRNRIIIAILVGALIAGLIWYQEKNSAKKEKVFDDKINYSTKTYKPYDTKFAYESFKTFAKKGFVENSKSIKDTLNSNFKGKGKLMVVISPYFLPTQTEVDSLLNFVEKGNDLYISAFTISSFFMNSAIALDSTDASFEFINNFPPQIIKGRQEIQFTINDTLSETPQTLYSYPGIRPTNTYGFFKKEHYGKKNLIIEENGDVALALAPYGDGNIYVNFCPITMTNYFVLHGQNYTFFNEIYNTINKTEKPIIWDRFYEKHKIQRPDPEYDKQPGDSFFWKVVEEHPTLGWAIVAFFLAIFLFILVHSRRMQKPMVVLPEPENNSLTFVKAIAGLYWLKQDHKKIADKIIQQFYDFISVNYWLSHKEINLENAEKIAEKSGKELEDISTILETIDAIKQSEKIDKKTLMHLYSKVHSVVNK